MLLGYLLRKMTIGAKNSGKKQSEKAQQEKDEDNLDKSLSKNIQTIKQALSESEDFKERKIEFGENGKFKASIFYIDGLVDSNAISSTIIKPILTSDLLAGKISKKEVLEKLESEIFWNSECEQAKTITEVTDACLKGDTVFLLDGMATAFILNTKGGDKRNIIEPQSESVVRGPREGFSESFRTNTSLLRRKIKNGNLKVEQMKVGRKTQTVICLVYLEDVAKTELVKEVKKRLDNLDVESILESGYIEQYIEDNPFSLFATMDNSEKPDIVAAKILEGRVAIVVDGTPFVLTVPMLFVESFQSSEDYYHRPMYSSYVRSLRYAAYIISVFFPAIYVALANFHQELIPTQLLFSIIKAKEGTPFPIFIETLFMVLSFEFLREAGIRLPYAVGQAVSIVGALIMGDAAVQAGIVGSPIVIVVAFTAVAGYLIPVQNNSTSMLRIIMLLLAAFAGWFGVSMGFLALLIHLASLKSFGVPYFDSFSNQYDLKDTFVRAPLWANLKRPTSLAGKDKTKSNFFVPPDTKTTYKNNGGGQEDE